MKTSKHKIVTIIASISLLVLSGCQLKFDQVEPAQLERSWLDSFHHTAVSWWYLGEKEGFHYIIEKWPLKKNAYKVSKEYVNIKLDKPLPFTKDQKQWINLKVGQLEFKTSENEKD